MSVKCLLGFHKREYFKKVFTVKGIKHIDSLKLRRRKCVLCGKYQGKGLWLRDDWHNLNPNEGNTIVPVDSL